VGGAVEGRHIKAGAAVVVLLVLAVVTGRSSEPGLFPSIFLAAALAVLVGAIAYHEGFKAGQRDLIDPPHLCPLTEDQRNRMLMRTTLPAWRRWLGVAAIVLPNLFFLPYVFVMTRYGGSGWLVLLYIILYLVLFGVGVWAMEPLWRPYSEAQREARRARQRESKLREGNQ
jgi:hypothetical protein